jgi:hypothetical protein
VRAERLGELHGEGAHATRGAVDQDLVSRPRVCHIAQPHQGGVAGQRDRGRLLETEVGRLRLDQVVRRAHVLGERSVDLAVHLVAGTEPGHCRADRLHPSGEVGAPDLHPGAAEPERHAGHVRVAPHGVPVPGIERGGVNPNQHLGAGGHRLVDVVEPQDVG